ncbi:helix-turn-helix domain-containing protein [Nocardia sp. NEAU-G5]|uniref:Helix-turn-helix domain-containing protein n=1 Tax=Nocardia albiluteola TaxID=2842303 RepID=A0ABS6B243_9NOCA|nr:helix-turn-helix domain-containing protein [Nocardia albiluteola]MBU3064369.1 helix-turn-helix domain-containing protein [Nocardia albiluteola]
MSTEEQIRPSIWYTTEEVAALLKVDASSLRRWRTASPPQGPPFVTLSGRTTRYSGADLMEYLNSKRIDPRVA